ncbi:MAG: hypothetical protein AAFV62_00295 [Pseudomonadota bacterium]
MIGLSDPLRTGSAVLAVIYEQCVHHGAPRGFWVCGRKTPRAVLVRDQGQTLAFEPDGRTILLEEATRRFPEACAAFERHIDASD